MKKEQKEKEEPAKEESVEVRPSKDEYAAMEKGICTFARPTPFFTCVHSTSNDEGLAW